MKHLGERALKWKINMNFKSSIRDSEQLSIGYLVLILFKTLKVLKRLNYKFH